MNLKQAKRLRRMAEKHTAGMKLVTYKPLKPVKLSMKDAFNVFHYATFLGQVTMDRCTRKEYHNAKKAYNRSKPHVLKIMALEGLRRPA